MHTPTGEVERSIHELRPTRGMRDLYGLRLEVLQRRYKVVTRRLVLEEWGWRSGCKSWLHGLERRRDGWRGGEKERRRHGSEPARKGRDDPVGRGGAHPNQVLVQVPRRLPRVVLLRLVASPAPARCVCAPHGPRHARTTRGVQAPTTAHECPAASARVCAELRCAPPPSLE